MIPLDLKLFVNFKWFKIPFSSIRATLSFRCMSEFFMLFMRMSLIHSSSPVVWGALAEMAKKCDIFRSHFLAISAKAPQSC